MDTDGYIVLRNIINEQVLDILKIQTKMHERLECFKINKHPMEYPFGDTQCSTSFCEYGLLCYESLLLYLKPVIEKYVGKELLPTYSYTRIYYNGSILKKHIDRPSCEYSVTICISIDQTPWDIYFANNKEVCITLYPGDLIIYKGMQLPHWREKYDGKQQIQAFLHYIDKNGCHTNLVNDNRPFIGIMKNS
jgi:hypothetical protein